MADRVGKPGPKPGYKQSPEHIAKRIKRGEEHPNWKGDEITERSGRSRALRAFPDGPCEVCGEPAERHHKDGNTANNSPSNIAMLCRRHHMTADGRLDAFVKLDRSRGEGGRYVRRAEAADH